MNQVERRRAYDEIFMHFTLEGRSLTQCKKMIGISKTMLLFNETLHVAEDKLPITSDQAEVIFCSLPFESRVNICTIAEALLNKLYQIDAEGDEAV